MNILVSPSEFSLLDMIAKTLLGDPEVQAFKRIENFIEKMDSDLQPSDYKVNKLYSLITAIPEDKKHSALFKYAVSNILLGHIMVDPDFEEEETTDCAKNKGNCKK